MMIFFIYKTLLSTLSVINTHVTCLTELLEVSFQWIYFMGSSLDHMGFGLFVLVKPACECLDFQLTL